MVFFCCYFGDTSDDGTVQIFNGLLPTQSLELIPKTGELSQNEVVERKCLNPLLFLIAANKLDL
jgi:hypothetical protein